jgi:cbb3-type cytochrome oxidase subunit 3
MFIEYLSAVGILVITILFLNPTHLTMPQSVQAMLTLGLILTFLSFSAFVLREHANDERESLHRLVSSRISYLAGVGTLVIGIIIEASMHEIDKWLVVTLCIMVLSKIFSRIYVQYRM